MLLRLSAQKGVCNQSLYCIVVLRLGKRQHVMSVLGEGTALALDRLNFPPLKGQRLGWVGNLGVTQMAWHQEYLATRNRGYARQRGCQSSGV